MSSVKSNLMTLCNGHPHAVIPWPHREIHDAIGEIKRLENNELVLRSLIGELMDELGRVEASLRGMDRKHSADFINITIEDVRERMFALRDD